MLQSKKRNDLHICFAGCAVKGNGFYPLKSAIRQAVAATLQYEKFYHPVEVSVTLCDNESIRAWNLEYRNKDTATDVLSFPMYEKEELLAIRGQALLGDIVISLERARTQAEEIGNSFLEEVAFLTIHSTLHLLGYDHELSAADDEDMCQRQKEIIKLISWKGIEDHD